MPENEKAVVTNCDARVDPTATTSDLTVFDELGFVCPITGRWVPLSSQNGKFTCQEPDCSKNTDLY